MKAQFVMYVNLRESVILIMKYLPKPLLYFFFNSGFITIVFATKRLCFTRSLWIYLINIYIFKSLSWFVIILLISKKSFFSLDFCFIDGICYSNGQTQLQKDSLVCQPNSSRTEWTLKDGKMISIYSKKNHPEYKTIT